MADAKKKRSWGRSSGRKALGGQDPGQAQTAGSSSAGKDTAPKAHNFGKARTFVVPTWCGLCGEFIWGITKQGHSCLECGFPIHRKCLKKPTPNNCNTWDASQIPKKKAGAAAGAAAEEDAPLGFGEAPEGMQGELKPVHQYTAPTPTPQSMTPTPSPGDNVPYKKGAHTFPDVDAPVQGQDITHQFGQMQINNPQGYGSVGNQQASAGFSGQVLNSQQQKAAYSHGSAPAQQWNPQQQNYSPQQQHYSPQQQHYSPQQQHYSPQQQQHGYAQQQPHYAVQPQPQAYSQQQAYQQQAYSAPPQQAPGQQQAYLAIQQQHGNRYGSPHPHAAHRQGQPQGYAAGGGFIPPAAALQPPGAIQPQMPALKTFGKLEPIQNYYDIGEVLGKGAFSEVRTCIERVNGKEWAVKIMKKNFRDPTSLQVTAAEIEIYQKAGIHSNIVQLHDIYENQTHWFLVLQKITGGELLHRITQLKRFSERDASEFAAQMLKGLKHLHDRNIVHRDLKPENLLLSDKTADASVLLTDFGLSTHLKHPNELIYHAVGTPGYVSPELVMCMQRKTPYGMSCDMWACGVIVYIMLCGFPPFWGSNNNELFHKITHCYYGFPSPWWDHVSDGAKDFIVRLLQPNPMKRLTVDQAMKHPWISSREKLQTLHLEQSVISLRKFNAKRRFKSAIQATIALGKLTAAITASSSSKQ